MKVIYLLKQSILGDNYDLHLPTLVNILSHFPAQNINEKHQFWRASIASCLQKLSSSEMKMSSVNFLVAA